MPKSLSDHQKKLASLYVLDALTEAEQINFEHELTQNEHLQSYCILYTTDPADGRR